LGITSSDTTLKAAFQHVVKNIPILQTVVVGDGDDAVFQKVRGDEENDDCSSLPSLLVESQVEKTETEMMERARCIVSDLRTTLAAGGKDAYRKSIRVHAVRCPEAVAFAFIVPHHFTDGAGISSIFSQLFVTQLLPSSTWFLMSMLTIPRSKRVQLPPNFDEMVLKRSVSLDIVKEIDVFSDTCLSPRYAKDNFCFSDYDPTSSDAISQLRGINEDLVIASEKSLKQTLKALKKGGISLTSAFSALAIKVLSRLIAESTTTSGKTSQSTSTDQGKRLLSNTPGDGRNLRYITGKDKHQRCQSKAFPVVRNYAFSLSTQIPFEDALKHPLEKIAKIFKHEYTRLQTDEKFRLHQIAAFNASSSISFLPGTPQCGTSSVLSSRVIQKMALKVSSEIRIDFGAVPRCWFYTISHGSQTVISADIHLPLANLTEAATRIAIAEECKGSALEHLLSIPTHHSPSH